MRLIIVGNGFDLNEGLDTSYTAFKKYMLYVNSDIVDEFDFFYGNYEEYVDSNVNEIFNDDIVDFDNSVLIDNNNRIIHNQSGELWNDLEKNMANISFPFLNRYFEIENEDKIKEICNRFEYCISELKKELLHWVRTINTNALYSKKIVGNNIFISFNYTDTLEKRYNVPHDKILYIHNCKYDNNLIFGCSNEYVEYFKIFRFDHEINTALSNGLTYAISKFFKPTRNIIINKLSLFLKENQIDEIVVLGFSFSDIDMTYLNYLHKRYTNAFWVISYREDSKQRINRFIKDNNIHCKLIANIDDFLDSNTIDI